MVRFGPESLSFLKFGLQLLCARSGLSSGWAPLAMCCRLGKSVCGEELDGVVTAFGVFGSDEDVGEAIGLEVKLAQRHEASRQEVAHLLIDAHQRFALGVENGHGDVAGAAAIVAEGKAHFVATGARQFG